MESVNIYNFPAPPMIFDD